MRMTPRFEIFPSNLDVTVDFSERRLMSAPHRVRRSGLSWCSRWTCGSRTGRRIDRSRRRPMDLMTIGAFAERTRLSAKALRLYDRLGLVRPARTDSASGYRFYSEDPGDGARQVALLRRLGMPLPVIADVVAKPPAEAAEAVGRYWAEIES